MEEKRRADELTEEKGKKKKKPKRVRTKKERQKRAITIIAVVLVIAVLGAIAFKFTYDLAADIPVASEPGKDVEIQVEDGMGVSQVADLLSDKGLIEKKFIFKLRFKLDGVAGEIKPGKYTVNTSNTQEEMIRKITSAPAEEEQTLQEKNE